MTKATASIVARSAVGATRGASTGRRRSPRSPSRARRCCASARSSLSTPSCAASAAPSKIAELRRHHLRPLVDELLAFAEREYERVREQRGSLRSALGYTVRQANALRAFLDDGRLRLDNNLSEGQLRKVVRIRDASLFAGSDEYAEAAGHILRLTASARLHELDPERHLRDLIRVMPHRPRARFLELSPEHWCVTRGRLDPDQLAAELGPLTVPDPDPAQ
jgi:transposase